MGEDYNLSNLKVRDRQVVGSAVDGNPSSGTGPTVSYWEQVVGKPEEFPPEAHTHPLGEIEQSGAVVGQVVTWDGSEWVGGTPASGASWVPLVDGSEPPVLISDGGGVLVLAAYGP